MKPGMGKQKGAQFERDVCVALSKWITDDQREDVFWRSAMSGGRATVAHKKSKKLSSQAGDVTCIHPAGQAFADKFVIECKNYADLDYIGLLTGKGKLLKFWTELHRQATQYNKIPFLIARQNRLPTHIFLNMKGLHELDYTSEKLLISPPFDMFIIDMKTFFSLCTPYV